MALGNGRLNLLGVGADLATVRGAQDNMQQAERIVDPAGHDQFGPIAVL